MHLKFFYYYYTFLCVLYNAVFGWYQDSFTALESESPYTLRVGYLKGAEQVRFNVTLNVRTSLDSASKSYGVIIALINQ